MKKHEVVVTIKPDGALELDVVGASGSSCEKVIGDLLASLGVEVTASRRKPEYYVQERMTTQTKGRR